MVLGSYIVWVLSRLCAIRLRCRGPTLNLSRDPNKYAKVPEEHEPYLSQSTHFSAFEQKPIHKTGRFIWQAEKSQFLQPFRLGRFNVNVACFNQQITKSALFTATIKNDKWGEHLKNINKTSVLIPEEPWKGNRIQTRSWF